ncbi:MAG: DEAD/DEAH box helicase [Hassallia sp.]
MSGIEMLEQAVASAFYGRFTTLHPAQEAAIEPLVNGKNVVLSSGTGSGKTEAVLAPLLSRYWRQAAKAGALTILYIAPTKALVNDLEKRLYPLLDRLGLRVGIRHGDRDDLVSGQTPHVLVTTPESLEVLLFRKDTALQTVQAVVIDEVHLLYNTQRGLQLSILLRRLKQSLERDLRRPYQRQLGDYRTCATSYLVLLKVLNSLNFRLIDQLMPIYGILQMKQAF